MSQTGYTPIQLYYSTTAATAPTAGNLASGELAINITDGKLFYKDNAGVVQTLATKATALSTVTNNGVVYVNSSGQATTGSALTFDGATLTNGGNIAALGGDFSGSGASGYVQLRAGSTDTNTMIIRGASAGARFEFDINGSEQMRLTSTGLGIGTSSPNLLSWNKATTLNTASGNAAYELAIGGVAQAYFAADATNVYLAAYANKPLLVRTNNATVATFDISGNLGLGVTPSAWNGSTALQMSNLTALSAGYDYSANLTFNVYRSGAGYNAIQSTVVPSRYALTGGGHNWYTYNGTVTAGAAITFTQAMTLDASGNLGIGATSNGNGYGVYIKKASTNSASVAVENNNGGWSIATSSNELSFNQFNIGERARIDSSGNLLVGTTTTGSSNLSGATLMVDTFGSYADIGHNSTATSGLPYARFRYSGSLIGSITQSGTTAVLYNVTSDQRLKENVVDAESSSALIDAIQVRQYDWKSDGSHQRYGFIAQELVTVAPEAVHQPADPEEMMAVDYSKLVPMLVKEIQSLRKRLADAGI
jgi:hypothetical protein